MRVTVSLMERFAASLAIAGLLGSVASADYITTLGVENQFNAPTGWNVGDTDSTYQEWDSRAANSGNVPDHGYGTNPAGLTAPTHSVKPPGFKTGTNNFYFYGGDFGATADIYNHGGPSGVGGYGANFGTHVIVQTGSTQNNDPGGWGAHTELVSGHGIGNFWDTMKLVDDVTGVTILGGDNANALQIAEVGHRTAVSTSNGLADYQELIYEFWLPGHTDDFRVDWDQVVHGTIDTLRVDSMIAAASAGGGSPFGTAVPEPSSAVLLGLAALGCCGYAVRRPCRRRGQQAE